MSATNQGGPGGPATRRGSGTIGRRSPRTGTEPAMVRSPLRLRLLLSAVFAPVFVAATVYFAVWAAGSHPGESPGRGPLTVLAVVCGVLALLALTDLVVVTRRLRRERAGAPATR
ncbi:DUF6343 family protein [Streptomyces sp. NPDC048278]|uniref:DUF6343 family protein n=1 Tax=Streptomyces sp. NPDC048278 TaxID=3155809 RepID=UPI00341656E7